MSSLVGPLRDDSGRPASPAERPGAMFLYPGRLFASPVPVTITTILGSCVAVGLWDEDLRIGGMNHFILPWGDAKSPRFANHALGMLVESILAAGARCGHLRAGVFGGAVLASRDHFHLGPRNVEAALRFLAEHSIPVVREDVGGSRGRKVRFDTGAGGVSIRRL